LLGAAEAQREAIGAPVLPHYRADYERTLATGRARLGEEAFAAAWTEGCGLPLAEAVVEALAAERPERRGRPTERVEGGVLNLTRREREVLRLLAAGHTDRESAAILCISPRTVERHVTNIVNKLGLPSRLAAVVYAARHGLV
jgi:DNA-binding CsgD family transcriptional regulator